MEIVIKDIAVNAFAELECLTSLPDDKINRYLLATINKGDLIRNQVFRLAMLSGEAPYYKADSAILAKPDAKVFALGIVGKGALNIGVHSLTTLVATQDQIFKRITWTEVGHHRSAGFADIKSVNKKKTLYWYLRKLVLDEDKKQAVMNLFANGI